MGQVVAGGSRNRNNFGKSIPSGLPCFQLNGIKDLCRPVQDAVVKSGDHLRT
jgi:hypothetical protein